MAQVLSVRQDLGMMKSKIYWLIVLAFFLQPTAAQQISGVVVDSSNNPLANAVVTVHGTSNQTVAANDGSFTLLVTGNNIVLVGAKKGYFYGSITSDSPANNVTIALDAVPTADNPNYSIQAPGQCRGCHAKQYNDWNNSPMAQSGFNTWVNDIYNGDGTAGGHGGFVYTRDSVFAQSNPNSECASCHQPQGWIETPNSALDSHVNNPTPAVAHGVSCDICHKVANVDTTKINFPGIYAGAVQFSKPYNGQQIQYGVLGDVTFSINSLMRGSYQPQMRAELCAACHQDAADPQQNESYNGVISEPTYLEWAASDYAIQNSPNYADCVDCHMQASDNNQVCSVIAPPPRPIEKVRNHRIEGSTPAYLENAVDLSMNVSTNNNQLAVNISIHNNQTGHHVPTGVTVRNMILLVQAWEDGNDPLTDGLLFTGTQKIHDLGGVGNPAQGYYAGLAGKLYAKVNHDANGNGPTFFTDATGLQFDNRIAANATDTTHYSFQLPNYQATIKVRARLIYRKAFRFLVDAKQWTQDGHGNPLADIAAPDFGFLMESAEQEITAGTTIIPLFNLKGLLSLLVLLFIVAIFALGKLKRDKI